MKAASAGALSLLGATWKVRKTASSWNQAQGALKKVTQIPRRRENGQTGERPGRRERGTVPGNQHRGEQEGKYRSDSIEEQRGEQAREGPKTTLQEHNGQQREEWNNTTEEREHESIRGEDQEIHVPAPGGVE